MKGSEIQQFIDRQQKISDRNFQNYQDTGEPRYMRTYHKADEMIDIARQALEAADDHQTVGVYRSDLINWGSRAVKVLHMWNEEDAMRLIRDIAETAKLRVHISDPWE